GLLQYGLHILAGFDVNPNVIGKEIADVKVHSIDDLSQVQSALQAHIAIIATPVAAAQQVAQLAVNAGFKAIWNFTPIRLRLPDNIVLHDTSIYAHLALIYNRLQHLQQAPVNQENEQK
ncbi:MAG: redox-sensing transcriptional repressor Rex, partial [Mogibacterium sp.]|nr:redox-sensing transcriptional repressor Rex [Mogibacterium sp.]